MTKILLLLLIVPALMFLGFRWAKKKLLSMFGVIPDSRDKQMKNANANYTSSEDQQVIYNKDDVVVLKGEANNTKKQG